MFLFYFAATLLCTTNKSTNPSPFSQTKATFTLGLDALRAFWLDFHADVTEQFKVAQHETETSRAAGLLWAYHERRGILLSLHIYIFDLLRTETVASDKKIRLSGEFLTFPFGCNYFVLLSTLGLQGPSNPAF